MSGASVVSSASGILSSGAEDMAGVFEGEREKGCRTRSTSMPNTGVKNGVLRWVLNIRFIPRTRCHAFVV